jgi:hypothetical protein
MLVCVRVHACMRVCMHRFLLLIISPKLNKVFIKVVFFFTVSIFSIKCDIQNLKCHQGYLRYNIKIGIIENVNLSEPRSFEIFIFLRKEVHISLKWICS